MRDVLLYNICTRMLHWRSGCVPADVVTLRVGLGTMKTIDDRDSDTA